MGELIVIAVDAISLIFWTAGHFVRQFELGREGYLHELKSTGGRKVVKEVKNTTVSTKQEEPSVGFPIGFA